MASTLHDELECAQLVVAWTYLLDSHEIERILVLFTPDGILHSRTGVDTVGPDAIRDVLAKRSPNRVTRHILAPAFIELTGTDSARGVTCFTVYDGYKDQHPDPGPMPLQPAVTVGEFHFTFSRTSAGWRIATAQSLAVFKQPD